MSGSYTLFETSYGACGVAWSEQGLTRVQLPEPTAAETERRLKAQGDARWQGAPPPAIAECAGLLQRYFAGAETDFLDVALDMRGVGPFEAAVYAALRQVGYGRTTSYGALARAVESPGAAQAIGMAMGRNPWPVIVPCHRVLAAAGKIGGFSAPGGVTTKRRLLGMESAAAPPAEDLFAR